MRSTLALLLPVASAMRAYTAPSSLRALVDANDACDFPDEYVIQDFVGKSNSTDGVLASYNFTFIDQTTTTTSLCHFNSTSVSTTPGGLTPRYACEDRDVQFIWEDDEKDLTMIQRVCPGADGISDYEVSGSLNLAGLSCSPRGQCTTNVTEYTSQYTSISPVLDPSRSVRRISGRQFHWKA